MELLDGQITAGSPSSAVTRLGEGGSVTVSQQVAAEHHLGVGDILPIPTPTGEVPFRIAATTTNFGWTPGAIVMSASDYQRDWASSVPSALGVDLAPSANPTATRDAVARALGPGSGLEVLTSRAREATIDASASEGLGQLGEISALLTIAAILALAAALGSSIWQRRRALAELRLEGASRRHLQLVLLLESTLMLGAGCVTGAVAGTFGQIVIDGYLKHVTGFPVAGITTGPRPIEIFVLVIVAVLALASVPGWFASGVPARLALDGSP